jgi:hypothetical protein
MDYEPLFNLPSGHEDIESVFKTGRGSTYAHHADTTTTRNRSGAQHRDTSTGIQQRSGKTVYMPPDAVNSIAGIYQNTEMATKLVPLMKDGKPTGQVTLQLIEDYGPKKAGTVLVTAPYSTKPAVGLNPVEVYGSESPMGSSGRNIHFGNAITEVHPRPARLGSALGKAGIAGVLAAGVGAVSAGDLKGATTAVGESVLPWWAQGSGLNTNEADELAYRQRMQEAQERGAGNRGRAYDPRKVQPITMPEDYKAGGRVKLI